MSVAYYNEIDPYVAQWIRNLVAAGHIAPGIVDERSIEDVHPSDLRGFTQCHFFAGIAVWSRAFRAAGWPDDRPVWSGSCPCQPFSAAGKGGGFADERHLWPAWFDLIRRAKPRAVPVFGEQVASNDGLAWLDVVCADLEAAGYAVGSADLCAAGFGAPHIRQRLFFVADPLGSRWVANSTAGGRPYPRALGDGAGAGLAGWPGEPGSHGTQRPAAERAGGATGNVAQPQHGGREAGHPNGGWTGATVPSGSAGARPGPTNGHWAAADWLLCTDGRWRPVEPGTQPLAHGAPARVGRLRAYGNAIVEQVATEFIREASSLLTHGVT